MSVRKPRAYVGYLSLAGLCLLLSTRWILLDTWPGAESRLSSQCLAAMLLCGICVSIDFLRRKARTEPEPWSGSALVAGALLFAGLDSGQIAGPVAPRGTDLFAALALAPIVISMVLSIERPTGEGLTGSDLVPGLLGSGGLLLIVQQPTLSHLKPDLVLFATPLCAGAGAVWLLHQHTGRLTLRRAAAASAGAAAVFAFFAHRPPYFHPNAVNTLLDLATMALAMGTLATLGVQRFAAQFALVPLLFLLEGLVLVRIRPTWEQVGGLVMLATAVSWMLFSPQAESERKMSLLLR